MTVGKKVMSLEKRSRTQLSLLLPTMRVVGATLELTRITTLSTDKMFLMASNLIK